MRKSTLCLLFLIGCSQPPPVGVEESALTPPPDGSPYITSTSILNAPTLGPGVYQLQVGVRYQIRVHVNPGAGKYTNAGVDVDPTWGTPASAHVLNGFNTSLAINSERDFDYTITPTAIGLYDVGFLMHDAPTNNTFNPAPPIEIHAVTSKSGVFGTVSSRVTGLAVSGVTVQLGGSVTTTASDGSYQFAAPGAPPYTISFSKPNYTETVATNVPGVSAIRVDAALDEAFTVPSGSGIFRLDYLDYSNGRTLLHLVQIDTSLSEVHVEVPPHGSHYVTGLDVPGSVATINGGLFATGASDFGKAQGYLYANNMVYPAIPIPSWFAPPSGMTPMFTIHGGVYDIVDSPLDLSAIPVNFDGAIQCGPWLVKDGIISNPVPGAAGPDNSWARNTIGLGGRFVYFLSADGEGNPGSAGANFMQLANFYRDVLGATKAMMLDGGGSTQLVMSGASGLRYLNTLTSEDNSPNVSSPSGRVLSFVSVHQKCVPQTCAQLNACGTTGDGCGGILHCSNVCRAGTFCSANRCQKCPTQNCQPQ